MWKTGDGVLHVLAADLEEGLDHSAVTERQVTVCLPALLDVQSGQELDVRLERMHCRLYSIQLTDGG